MDEDRQPAGARTTQAAGRAAGRGGRRAPRALTAMVLHGLQSLLGRLYDVELNYDIYDFLVTDRGALRGVAPINDARASEEELLLAETPDGAGVALSLDPALFRRLDGADPVGELTENNLADYCTALEGVSHFVYSTWRLDRDLPVSLLHPRTPAAHHHYPP